MNTYFWGMPKIDLNFQYFALLSKNDHNSFVKKLIIFWQAYTYKYWTILSNTQLDGEIESVHKKIFFWKKSQESSTGLYTAW